MDHGLIDLIDIPTDDRGEEHGDDQEIRRQDAGYRLRGRLPGIQGAL